MHTLPGQQGYQMSFRQTHLKDTYTPYLDSRAIKRASDERMDKTHARPAWTAGLSSELQADVWTRHMHALPGQQGYQVSFRRSSGQETCALPGQQGYQVSFRRTSGQETCALPGQQGYQVSFRRTSEIGRAHV